MIISALLVFLAMLACDFAWTKYMMHAAAKQPYHAAAWSAAIIAFSAINVVAYTSNHWLLIPALLGAYVGTWLAVWRDSRKPVAAAPMGQPYDGCQCNCCVPKGTPPRLSGTVPAGACPHCAGKDKDCAWHDNV